MNQKKNAMTVIILLVGVSFLFSNLSRQETAKELFEKAIYMEETKGDLEKAIAVYDQIIKEFPDERAIAAKAQLQIGMCCEKLGLKEAEKAFQKVVDNYPDQTEAVKTAKDRLSLLLKAKAVLDQSNQEFRLRKITQDSSVDPRDLSPDGRYISYTDWMGGVLGVYEVATGKKRYLDKKESQMVLGSCWSPDGKWIAYNAMNEGPFWDLRIIDFEGTEPKVVYKEEGSFIHPVDWSPDGKYVLVGLWKMEGQKASEGQIALVSIDDGSVNTIKTLDHTDPRGGISAAFSPDGRYLAFSFSTKKGSSSNDISVISMDGKEEFSLVENPADDSFLAWTPDGKNILFVSDRRGTKDLWMIGVEEGKLEGEPVKIQTNIGGIYSLGFSKNASFFYGMGANTSDIYWAELDAEKGVFTSLPKEVVKPGLGTNYAPEWSPDGKYMAYATSGQGDHSLRVLSLETGEVREVSRPDVAWLDGFSGLRWSPEGSSLLILGYAQGNTNAYITDIETGDMTTVKLDKTGDRLFNPAWSIDRKTIYYLDTNWKKNLTCIMAHDIETGQSREIANDTNNPLHLDISPDGKRLAYAVINRNINAMVLRTVDVSNGEKHEVVQIQNKGEVTDATDPSQLEKVRQVGDMCWAPDGRSFYCYTLFWPESNKGEDQIVELWNYPIDGGAPKRFYEGNEFGFGSLRFHPDGKRFAFRMQSLSYEIWAMDNFLPVEKKD
jgi:Tol biopolymer transport system component